VCGAAAAAVAAAADLDPSHPSPEARTPTLLLRLLLLRLLLLRLLLLRLLLLLLLQILILPIPPLKPAHPQFPSAKLADLLKLSDDVAAFNVMTYDYSHSKAGPNGPLLWQEENVQEMMGDESDPDEEESDRAGGEWLYT
jgi:hypothetical protein